MTVHWVKRGPHRCALDEVWGRDGDVVECDVCGRRWKFHNPGNPAYAGWRRQIFRRRRR